MQVLKNFDRSLPNCCSIWSKYHITVGNVYFDLFVWITFHYLHVINIILNLLCECVHYVNKTARAIGPMVIYIILNFYLHGFAVTLMHHNDVRAVMCTSVLWCTATKKHLIQSNRNERSLYRNYGNKFKIGVVIET
jgi:hypothetical protein